MVTLPANLTHRFGICKTSKMDWWENGSEHGWAESQYFLEKITAPKASFCAKKHEPFHSQKKQSPVSRARYLIKCLYLYKMGQRPLEK